MGNLFDLGRIGQRAMNRTTTNYSMVSGEVFLLGCSFMGIWSLNRPNPFLVLHSSPAEQGRYTVGGNSAFAMDALICYNGYL